MYVGFLKSVDNQLDNVTSQNDANGNWTQYTYDSMLRPTLIEYPGGGQTSIYYSTWSGFMYSEEQTKIDSSRGTTTYTLSDGLGRVTRSVRANGQSVIYDQVDTCYDARGNVGFQSSPYHSSSGFEATRVCSGAGDAFTYDALGRATSVQHADSDTVGTVYTGNCSTASDEVGKARKSCSDGLGRVTGVGEDPTSGGANYATGYSHDPLSNLMQSVQSSQTRTYTYDSLSRLLKETSIPETGTTCYGTYSGSNCQANGYDANGDLIYKTDARGVVTTYTYDALNRLTQKSYSDTSPNTPTAKYYYDSTDCLSLSACYNVGHRTGISEGSGSTPTTKWAYDKMGNILRESRTINGQTKTISYTYNLDGSIASITYPGNRVVSYAYNVAQRATAATDSGNSINYAGQTSLAEYAPNGALASVVYGYVSGGFAGVTESRTYNNRLQLTGILASSSAGAALDLSYSYAQSSHNNGDITTQTNNSTSGRTQTYTYDNLNRLLTAQAAATSGGDCWGQSFGNNSGPTLATDALANLFYSTSTKCSSPQPRYTMDYPNTNHFADTGMSYDYAGNNTADTVNSYTYDAENRMSTATVSSVVYCFTYDADGIRTAKFPRNSSACTNSPTSAVLYWRNIAGNTIAETDKDGATNNSSYHEYVFFAGRRIARADWGSSSFTVYYYFVDHLGSTRVMTSASGSACYKADYLPYGAENTPSGFTNTCNLSSQGTMYKFTGYERDTETGLDYAFARYYNQRLGRFMSGDPLLGDTGDPQSLNRYAYVRNNPINFIDPTGAVCLTLPMGLGGPVGIICDGQPAGGGGGGGDTSWSSFGWGMSFNSGGYGGVPNYEIPGCGESSPSVCGDPYTYSPLAPTEDARVGSQDKPQTSAPNNAPQTPWYNTCTAKAVGNGLLHAGIDAIGLIPEGSFVSRAVGNAFDYRGIVADQFGNKVLGAVAMGTGIGSTGVGAFDKSPTGQISTGLGAAGIVATLAGFTPAGQVLSGLQMAADIGRAGMEIAKCN